MAQQQTSKKLPNKNVDLSKWYIEVILRTEMADYAPVKGCMVIRPYGYALWENIQRAFDAMIKAVGVKNAYFPLFIPEGLLRREKEHVQGFSPELAVVTIGGGEELKEKLVVRPTSETIMYEMYARWLKSWRDLPILINQWNNVVRWEKRTYLFLRTTEFLWQEGHTVHETHEEALKMVHQALDWYIDLYQNWFAIDGISGIKSGAEKFAGADKTTTYEMMMPDGKMLQGCTSHDLGQNFAKVFNMTFSGRNDKQETPWQTSWGLSTRSIGALIMTHGDNQGLIMPPKLAPIQVVITTIFSKEVKEKALIKKGGEVKTLLTGVRVEVDNRTEYSAGWKFNEWELKGVPLRIELGYRELKNEEAVVVRRDTGEKVTVKMKDLPKTVDKLLLQIHQSLFLRSRKFLQENTRRAKTYQQFQDIMNNTKGLIKAFWCEDPECEVQIKKDTKASTRLLPFNAKEQNGKCVRCQKPATHQWLFAQAY